jgi:cytidylate kinase
MAGKTQLQAIGKTYMSSSNIITIDGPSAAGKSTLARELARKLGWTFLDTGAIYRAAALACLEKGLSERSPDQAAAHVRGLDIRIQLTSDKNRIFLGDREVSELIRSEEVSNAASRISSLPEVRSALKELQLRQGENGRLVSEGRDQGTKIFPDAKLKFFLTATPEERASRRFKELKGRGEAVEYEEVLKKINERDMGDQSRAEAPLTIPPGAVSLNSTDMSREDVLDIMERKAREVFAGILQEDQR